MGISMSRSLPAIRYSLIVLFAFVFSQVISLSSENSVRVVFAQGTTNLCWAELSSQTSRDGSPDVWALQYLLLTKNIADLPLPLEANGNFDEATRSAVATLLPESNGIVNADVWNALIPEEIIDIDSENIDANAIRAIQYLLRYKFGIDTGNSGRTKDGVDGDFAEKTEEAVREFQTLLSPGSDGDVGPITWSALLWSPSLHSGTTNSNDPNVRAIQYLLKYRIAGLDIDESINADEVTYTPETAQAVTAFQIENGIPADGIVGPATWLRLVTGLDLQLRDGTGDNPERNDAVKALQHLLSDKHLINIGDDGIDGKFGTDTQTAVTEFKSNAGLPADNAIVTFETWVKLICDFQCGGVLSAASVGMPPVCDADEPDDADGDGLSDDTERMLGTDINNPDTDGDGLLDPWEVPSTFKGIPVPGAGFGNDIDTDGDGIDDVKGIDITRDEVFGPYADGKCKTNNFDKFRGYQETGRPSSPCAMFVHPPNAWHKDVYLEIDWQDCLKEGCPGDMWGRTDSLGLDTTHHAPNISGIAILRRHFANGPQSNPDGRNGISLHVLIDERLEHVPNCDTLEGGIAVKAKHFGSPLAHRDNLKKDNILKARKMVYRYAWSGHSRSNEDNKKCRTPWLIETFLTGITALYHLPDYDYSRYGEVNLGGNDIIITLGPLWICPYKGRNVTLVSQCSTDALKPWQALNPFDGKILPDTVGIYPARVEDERGNVLKFARPVSKQLEKIDPALEDNDNDGTAALWSRSLSRLLSYALGANNTHLDQNYPQRRFGGLELKPIQWPEEILYAPQPTDGTPLSKNAFSFPLHGRPVSGQILASSGEVSQNEMIDLDNDGIDDFIDNCPDIPNIEQADLDDDNIGDICDLDIDGDRLELSEGFTYNESADALPYDSDNDNKPNSTDTDDDNDNIVDNEDNCPIAPNTEQIDSDNDLLGDDCDLDDDNDGIFDTFESYAGSDPLDSDSQIEFLGLFDSCSDQEDNDLNGLIDDDDPNCVDSDGDGLPNPFDNCPAVANLGFLDTDNDGLGDSCDVTPYPVNEMAAITVASLEPTMEGGQFSVKVSATEVEFGALSFEWDTNGDGIYSASGDETELDALSFDGPGVYSVSVKVSDGWGMEVIETVEIEILNADPQGLVIDYQQIDDSSIDFTATFTDAGELDTHTITWDWGDDSISQTEDVPFYRVATASHEFPDDGPYDVTVTITDDDGGSTTLIVENVPNGVGNVDAAASVTSVIWNDANRNDVQDAGEGAGGTVVKLYGGSDLEFIEETETDANGQFTLAVPIGEYRLSYELPGRLRFDPEDENIATTDGPGGWTVPFVLERGDAFALEHKVVATTELEIDPTLQLDHDLFLPFIGQ